MTQLTEEEFNEKVEDIAKDAIREHCVLDDNTVEYVDYASEYMYQSEVAENLLETHTLAIEKYCTGKFDTDARDLLSLEMSEAIMKIREHLLRKKIDNTIEQLLNGGWNAVRTETVKYTDNKEKTVLNES